MTITDSARRLALVAIVAMLAALMPLSGALAQEDPDVPGDDDRLAIDLDGDDAVEYAIRWSQVVYSDDTIAADEGPTEALIGRADLFADSLASGVLQQDRPLLLTPQNTLSADVAAELERLGVETVHIMGGDDAVAPEVEDELAETYEVNRFEGETRIETAIDVAESIDSDTAILARAFAGDDPTQAFADSLAAGGWAAGDNVPVLFTQTEVLTGNTADHIAAAGYTNIIIVGGDAAVSDEVEAEVSELVESVERVAGDTRFETAVAIAEARGYENPDTAEGVILVDGQSEQAWADGFPAANLSGMGWPIVLSNSADDSLPEVTVEYLERTESGDAVVAGFAQDDEDETVTDVEDGNVVMVCGSTVPDGDEANEASGDQCTEAATAFNATVVEFAVPGGEEPPAENNETLALGPDEAAENEVSASANSNEGARAYTVTDVDDATEFTVVLFAADDVSVDEDGNVSFTDDPNNGTADRTVDNVGAVIEVVNGTAISNPDNLVTVNPVNGTITFTIDSTTADDVVPVVFVDADDDTELDLDADADEPTEAFGIGGQKTYIPAEAGTGELTTDEEIASVDEDLDRIVTENATYFYDANDQFFVVDGEAADAVTNACTDQTNRVTLAQFEAELSAGDQLDESTFYNTNSELPSTLCLEDLDPGAPVAQVIETTDTTATFTVTGIRNGATVTVYCGPDDDDAFAAEDTQRGQSTTDQDASQAGFQVIATGLTADTEYDCFITQTVGGEESAPSGRLDVTTRDVSDPPIITDAVLEVDAPIEGRVGTGDEWRLVFDENLDTSAPLNGATIDLVDPDGDTIRVRCATAAPTTDFYTDATCTFVDGADADANDGDELEITLLENAEDRNAAGDAGTTGGGIQYPLTITNTDGLVDEQGEEPDIAASTDVVIDEE